MEGSAVLTKSASVLELLDAVGDEAIFVRREPEAEVMHLQRVPIPRRLWDELGKPDNITVTIEPGDKLNVEEGNDGGS